MYIRAPDSDLGVVRLSDRAFIPKDQRNADWAEYTQWVAAGNTPTVAAATSASAKAQLAIETKERETLMSREMREFVLEIMDSLPQGKQTKLAAMKAKVQAVEDAVAVLRAVAAQGQG